MMTPDITVSRAELQRLVFAARHVAFDGYFDGGDDDARAQLQELDAASEAFAATFPWEDEPSLTADEEAELVARINVNPNLHPQGELTSQFVAMNGRDKWETLVLNGLIGTDEPWIEALTKTLREEADRLESLLSDRAAPTEELIDELLSLKPFLEAHHCRTDAIDRAVSRLSDRAKLEEALETILTPHPLRDTKWAGMTLGDIARFALNRTTDHTT